jgi:hypothetical protein
LPPCGNRRLRGQPWRASTASVREYCMMP